MKGRLLPVAVTGLLFFLGIVLWQWCNFSSMHYTRSQSDASRDRGDLRAKRSDGQGSIPRKLGLQQESFSREAAVDVRPSLDKGAANRLTASRALRDPAIILFCYDRWDSRVMRRSLMLAKPCHSF